MGLADRFRGVKKTSQIFVNREICRKWHHQKKAQHNCGQTFAKMMKSTWLMPCTCLETQNMFYYDMRRLVLLQVTTEGN